MTEQLAGYGSDGDEAEESGEAVCPVCGQPYENTVETKTYNSRYEPRSDAVVCTYNYVGFREELFIHLSDKPGDDND